MPHLPSSSLFLIICGPAGSGKTTLCARLREEFPRLRRLVTTTSRPPRPGEVEGVDYHFLSPDQFEAEIERGAFVEWARVHGRYYGSRIGQLRDALREGVDLLLNIDVQGARSFRAQQDQRPELAGRVHTVFIRPKSLQQLRERLLARGTDDEAEIARRLRTAEREIELAGEFDLVVTSGSREEDYDRLREFYRQLHAAKV